jgi:hypothetical protein
MAIAPAAMAATHNLFNMIVSSRNGNGVRDSFPHGGNSVPDTISFYT